MPLWRENWSTTCIDLVAAATSFSKHYVEFKVPTISHKPIAFLEFPFLLASFYILLTIIRHCQVTNKRIKKCLSIAMKIGQREGSDVRVIYTMHNQLHKLLTHRKRARMVATRCLQIIRLSSIGGHFWWVDVDPLAIPTFPTMKCVTCPRSNG